ncbi:MAG: bacteriohemerythrin [Spirochaetes bacterium]|nr:bacteriohemerythrin [Spirochaetota bacterium]
MDKPKKEHITWSQTYSMGIKIIDDQHKGLLNFVNDLFNNASGDEARERAYFQRVVHEAVKYVKTHFATEEKYMLAAKFPGYAEHKKAHEEFVFTIIQSVKDFEAGKRLALKKLAYFLRDWILSHVAIMDRQYSDYFWKIATRKADGKLSITQLDISKLFPAVPAQTDE